MGSSQSSKTQTPTQVVTYPTTPTRQIAQTQQVVTYPTTPARQIAQTTAQNVPTFQSSVQSRFVLPEREQRLKLAFKDTSKYKTVGQQCKEVLCKLILKEMDNLYISLQTTDYILDQIAANNVKDTTFVVLFRSYGKLYYLENKLDTFFDLMTKLPSFQQDAAEFQRLQQLNTYYLQLRLDTMHMQEYCQSVFSQYIPAATVPK